MWCFITETQTLAIFSVERLTHRLARFLSKKPYKPGSSKAPRQHIKMFKAKQNKTPNPWVHFREPAPSSLSQQPSCLTLRLTTPLSTLTPSWLIPVPHSGIQTISHLLYYIKLFLSYFPDNVNSEKFSEVTWTTS